MATPWRTRIPIPHGINTRHSPARVSTLTRLFGSPVGELTADCQNKNVSRKIKKRIVTRHIGPFKVTGFDLFLNILEKAFIEFKRVDPMAYADLSNHGVLCVRLVRGSNESPSTHCWGTAIDLGFNKVVDTRGDGKTYEGLLTLYSILKLHGIYWGASFRTEDAMHFEVSNELLLEWESKGLI